MIFTNININRNCWKILHKSFSKPTIYSFCQKKPQDQIISEQLKISLSEIKMMKQMMEGKYDLQSAINLQNTNPQFAQLSQYLQNNTADVFNTKQQKLSFQLIKCQISNQVVELTKKQQFKLTQQTDPNTMYLVLHRYFTLFYQESASHKLVRPKINPILLDLHKRFLECCQHLQQDILLSMIQFDSNHIGGYHLSPQKVPLLQSYNNTSVLLLTKLLQKYPSQKQKIVNHYKLGTKQEIIEKETLFNIVKLLVFQENEDSIKQLFISKISIIYDEIKNQQNVYSRLQDDRIEEFYNSFMLIIHSNQEYFEQSKQLMKIVINQMSNWQILQLLYNSLTTKKANDQQIIMFLQALSKYKHSISTIQKTEQQEQSKQRTASQFLLKLSNTIAIIYKQHQIIYAKYSQNLRQLMLLNTKQVQIDTYQENQLFQLIVNFATIFPPTINNSKSKQFIKRLILQRLFDLHGDNLAICVIIADKQQFLKQFMEEYLKICSNLQLLQSYSGPFSKPLKTILENFNKI